MVAVRVIGYCCCLVLSCGTYPHQSTKFGSKNSSGKFCKMAQRGTRWHDRSDSVCFVWGATQKTVTSFSSCFQPDSFMSGYSMSPVRDIGVVCAQDWSYGVLILFTSCKRRGHHCGPAVQTYCRSPTAAHLCYDSRRALFVPWQLEGVMGMEWGKRG